ncbi:uncharacterized protein Fot_23059 [Forsythia ovata]|uniref:Uncharacterized protein n=1 Tax=Forsythia ovata TaxID=205694 RepID=A0ABD1UZG3_9LAMI
MHGAENPSIAGMVLDSPFSDLVDLMMELVDTNKFRLLKLIVAKSCFVPVLIGHAVKDDFIQPRHSDLIFDAYMLPSCYGPLPNGATIKDREGLNRQVSSLGSLFGVGPWSCP